ncbi:MAG: cytochrome c [Pyrinomonadaceae bacterium]
MKLIKLGLLCFVVILFTIACSSPSNHSATHAPSASPAANPATPDEFAGARAIFLKECVACHGENGQGGNVKVDEGTLKVPSLREGHALKHPDSEFVDQINNGGDGMPAFKDKLKPEEINALVHFIHHEFQGGATPPPEPAKKN